MHVLRETRTAEGQTLEPDPASRPPQSWALGSLPPCLAGECRVRFLASRRQERGLGALALAPRRFQEERKPCETLRVLVVRQVRMTGQPLGPEVMRWCHPEERPGAHGSPLPLLWSLPRSFPLVTLSLSWFLPGLLFGVCGKF